MNQQQILGRQKDSCEDSLDQFEEFKQQFTTYEKQSNVSPNTLTSFATPKKITLQPKSQKPKLKIIKQNQQNSLENCFLNNNRKIRKAISANSKIINIGNVLFRSNFQSGNIQSVAKIAPNIYEIYLNKQTNSQRTSAWFYFSCEGLKGENKFIIKGFTKASSLYNEGMRICYKEVGENSVWRRGGTKICYTDSESEDEGARTQYQLRFSFFFKNTGPNTVEFAYCFPYTYTNLINFLTLNKAHLTLSTLGKSYQGRGIPLVTIGNEDSKQVIVISARAHPGQTVGSWMMQGFLKELMSENEYSKNLRQAFLFKIVPMINVDGVAQGNYRFSGSGFDLNRKWKKCKEKYHPEIYHLKKFIKNLNSQKQVLMYIDLHGHSRQKNVFFYGCCPKGYKDQQGNLNSKPKQFPYLMSKLHYSFRYDYCSYAVQKEKEGTARITMWNQLKIDYVYTLQASFCGNEGGQNYQIADYQKIGAKLSTGICLYFHNLIQKNLTTSQKSSCTVSSKLNEEFSKNMNQFYENPSLAEIEFEGNSSDSEPEAGQIPEQCRKNKINNSVVSMQKYYKASKMVKLSEKSRTQDEKNLKQKILKREQQQEQKLKEKNNTIYSINLQKVQYSDKRTEVLKQKRPIRTSNVKTTHNSYSVRAEILNKTIHEKLNQLQKTKNRTQEQINMRRQHVDKCDSEEFFPSQRIQITNSKKKAISFEGAQYRRVRKLAEEHNKRHFSVEQTPMIHEDEELIKGLIGMNNLLQIDSIKASKRSPSFFPNTNKNRRQSMQMHFKKQIKINDFSTRRLQINGLDQEVKCFGRQII